MKVLRIAWAFILAAVLVAALCVAFAGVGRFGLFNLDDYDYLVRSSAITGGVTVEGLRWAWQTTEHAIWMPLTWLSYMLDFEIGWGFGGAHLQSVAWHAANALLVLLVFRRILAIDGRCGPGAAWALGALGAGIWALHPLRCESVVWLASRKDVLSFFFEACATLAWVETYNRRVDEWRFWGCYLLALLCFALGATGKPSVMTFPLLVATLDVFVVRRVRPWMYGLPAVMMIAIGLEAAVFQQVGGARDSLGFVPLFARLTNAMAAFGVYLANTVYPLKLAVQCLSRYPALPRGLFVGIVLSLGAAGWILIRFAQMWRDRGTVFVREDGAFGETSYRVVLGKVEVSEGLVFAGLLWFCIGIGPFLGILNFGYHAFADRFTYIPSIGLSMVLLGFVMSMGRRIRGIVVGMALVVVMPCLVVLTRKQVSTWTSEKSVWLQTLNVDGETNVAAHQGLGLAYFELDHDIEKACLEFQRVRELSDLYYRNCVEIHVYALCEAGRFQEAQDALSFFAEYAREYGKQHVRTVQDPLGGSLAQSQKLRNFSMAEIAVDLCNPVRREQATAELKRRISRGEMSRTHAYLLHRLGVVTGDAKLEAWAMEQLAETPPTDFLQFRYLLANKGDKK